MKKLSFLAVTAIVAATLASCGDGAPKASLKSDVDTLSYAAGISLGNEFNQYQVYAQQMGLDSAYMADFLKGVGEGAAVGDNKRKAAYLAGLQIGQQIGQQIALNMGRQFFGDDTTKAISKENLVAAFLATVAGKGAKMTSDEADSIQRAFRQHQEEARQAKLDENKKAGEAFIAENRKEDGIQVTESGLQYRVITEGNGKKPTADDRVKVEYEGKLIDGTVFDASSKHGDEPAEFGVGQVIPGWTEGLQLMTEGSEYEFFIPQELAYGARDMGNIKPYSALIFKVKLIEVVKK